MNRKLKIRGKAWLGFLAISLLVTGGLAWATYMALEVEHDQRTSRAINERNQKLRLALWRLDSRVFPVLAREANRPFQHYRALYSTSQTLIRQGKSWRAGEALQPSPLLNEPLPKWVLLHFQVSTQAVPIMWESPQVLNEVDMACLNANPILTTCENVTGERKQVFQRLQQRLKTDLLQTWMNAQIPLLALEPPIQTVVDKPVTPQVSNNDQVNETPPQQFVPSQRGSMDQEFQSRFNQKAQIEQLQGNRSNYKQSANALNLHDTTTIRMGVIQPLWLPNEQTTQPDTLLMTRLVQLGSEYYCQGFVLDWPVLAKELAESVQDLFPQASLAAIRTEIPERPEQTMTALPLELLPNEPISTHAQETWSPMRISLLLAWCAAGLALLAVGLGGWSLLELSERRIRFISTVTHELRTPLTTLRLYSDMLTNGLIKDEEKKTEYLSTLHQEAERLHRLIANVLDYSRLENHSLKLERKSMPAQQICDHIMQAWKDRCEQADKQLTLEAATEDLQAMVHTDPVLVEQILGNLIDNACKYSQKAGDTRIWLRVTQDRNQVYFLVEDHGPGIPLAEQKAIFQPFQRGKTVDVTSAGVGLGLALARRWAHLLGGHLHILTSKHGCGACFQLAIPK